MERPRRVVVGTSIVFLVDELDSGEVENQAILRCEYSACVGDGVNASAVDSLNPDNRL
jgi:hypothetical protein